MILDKELVFSSEQAVTADAASTNVLDLKAEGDAVGQELAIHAVVTANFATLTSLTIKVQTSADNSSWSDVVLSPAIPVASLKKGEEVFCIRVPKGFKRYVRLYYDVTGSNATAGKVTAFMCKDI